MVITICIGSSCHLKGSRKIVDKFNELIKENNIGDRVSLNGSFCCGECMKGVCVKIDGELHSVLPENAEDFFHNEIMGKL